MLSQHKFSGDLLERERERERWLRAMRERRERYIFIKIINLVFTNIVTVVSIFSNSLFTATKKI